MPHIRKGYLDKRKCKYCDKPAKIAYFGIKRRHKGYYKTCGSKKCLSIRYKDTEINRRKSWISRDIKINCQHCGRMFVTESSTHKWCRECVPDKASRAIIQRYGLNKKEYIKLKKKYNLCPICLKRNPKMVDHNHENGVIRGMLCNHCNGMLNIVEDKNKLNRAIKYLRG